MGANVCPKYGGRVQGPTRIPTPIRVMESETHTDTNTIHGARSPSRPHVPFILHGTRLAYSTLPLQTRLVSSNLCINVPIYTFRDILIWINFKSPCTSISRRNLAFRSFLVVFHSLLLARRFLPRQSNVYIE